MVGSDGSGWDGWRVPLKLTNPLLVNCALRILPYCFEAGIRGVLLHSIETHISHRDNSDSDKDSCAVGLQHHQLINSPNNFLLF